MVLKCFEGFADNMEDAFVCKINHQFILKVFFFPPKKRSKVDYSASVPHHRYYWRKKGVWKNPKGHETHGEITMSKCCREQPEVEYYFFCEDLSNNPWMMRLIANGKSAVREKLIYIYIYIHTTFWRIPFHMPILLPFLHRSFEFSFSLLLIPNNNKYSLRAKYVPSTKRSSNAKAIMSDLRKIQVWCKNKY